MRLRKRLCGIYFLHFHKNTIVWIQSSYNHHIEKLLTASTVSILWVTQYHILSLIYKILHFIPQLFEYHCTWGSGAETARLINRRNSKPASSNILVSNFNLICLKIFYLNSENIWSDATLQWEVKGQISETLVVRFCNLVAPLILIFRTSWRKANFVGHVYLYKFKTALLFSIVL